MATIEIPDELYNRVEQFTPVVRAVLNKETDTSTSFGIILERGLQATLGDIVARQKESVFFESIHQLAARNPTLVYGYVADMIGLGADIRESRRRQIGFRLTSSRKRSP